MMSHSKHNHLKLALLPIALATITGSAYANNFGFSTHTSKAPMITAPVITAQPLQNTLELDEDVTPTYNSYGNQNPHGPFGDRLDRDVPGVHYEWGNGIQPAVQSQPGGPEILVNNLLGGFPRNGTIQGMVYAKYYGVGQRPLDNKGKRIAYSPLTSVFIDGVAAHLNHHDTFDRNSIASFSGSYVFDDPRTLDFIGIEPVASNGNKPFYARQKKARPSVYGRKGKDTVTFEAFDNRDNVDRKTFQRHYASTNQEAYVSIDSRFIYDQLVPELESAIRTKLNPRRLLSNFTIDKSWGQVRFPNTFGSARIQEFTVDCFPDNAQAPGSCLPAIRFTVKLDDIQTDIDINSRDHGNWDFRVSADYLRLSGWVVLANKDEGHAMKLDVKGLDFGYSNLETSGADGADFIDSFLADAVDLLNLDDFAVDLAEELSISTISKTLSDELTALVDESSRQGIKELAELSLIGIMDSKSNITQDAVELVVESNLDAINVSPQTLQAFGSLWNPIQEHDKPVVENWRGYDIAFAASTNLLNRAMFAVFRADELSEVEVYGGDQEYISAIELGTLLGLAGDFPTIFQDNHQGRVVLTFESSPYVKLHKDENSFIDGEVILHANNIKLSVQQRRPKAYGDFPWESILEVNLGIQHPVDFDIDAQTSAIGLRATPDTLPVISVREPRLLTGTDQMKTRFATAAFVAMKTSMPLLTQPIVDTIATLSLNGINIPSIAGYDVTPNDIWVVDHDNDGFGWLMFAFDVEKQQNGSPRPSAEELADRYQNSDSHDEPLVPAKPIDQFGVQCKYGPCNNNAK